MTVVIVCLKQIRKSTLQWKWWVFARGGWGWWHGFWDYLDTERKEAIWMGAQMNVNVLNSRKMKPQALKDLRAPQRLTTSDLRTKQSLFLRTKQSL